MVAVRVDAALQNIAARVWPGRVGYATVWDGDKYVQCAHPPAGGWRCEAAGARMQPSLERVLTTERQADISALGWRLDPAFGNFVRFFDARTPTDQIAAALLTTLVDDYGANLADIEIGTRWVADEPCPPRNGYTQNLAGVIDDAPAMAATAVHACSFQPPSGDAAAVASADELVARFGPRVAAEIQRLRINEARQVFVIFDAGIGYIQCQPDHASIYCEAQSADSWPALASVLTPDRVARLHAAGYDDPGMAPNYSRRYPEDRYDDGAIAAELLTLLHDVYGYAGAFPLDITTEEGGPEPQTRAQPSR